MPDGASQLLIALVFLVLCSAFFSAAETAYSCASRIKLKTLFSNGNKNAGKVLELTESKYDRLLSTILIGNNIVNISASALATVFFGKLLVSTKIDSTLASTVVMTVAVLLFGEITPKYIAKAYPERFSLLFYPVIKFVYFIMVPLTVFFTGWKNLVSRVFQLDRNEVITEEEIITFVEEAEDDGTLRKEETNLIRSVIDFDDLEAKDVLTPRVKISAVDCKFSYEEVKNVFETSGFSRLPVYENSIDSIIGMIHVKDFYSGKNSIRDIMQPCFFTPEHTKLSKLLKTFQKNRTHIAVVLDEYGGTLGIITLEDILEELVGEIWDEHDDETEEFQKLDDGDFIFDGDAELEKVFLQLGINVEDVSHESNTLSGWLLEDLGEVPHSGTSFDCSGLHVEVLESDEKKIIRAKLNKIEKGDCLTDINSVI
ncbi:hemolysin family protein [Treponema sp.]|uniref:HlyC/CorC family transporter n=1 Tax=Treponema sp. TaxID=166 RepID=UPI00257989EE|nr:hemolysin family protein [Treponema sp.]MBE6355096.1 HlyC/CorC family transporter [Treponema sp.]